MARVLVTYAHPGQRYSRANARLWQAAHEVEGIETRDLYALYPRFDIDVEAERALIVSHDVLLFQFPVFWYSAPALVKEWLDLVLEHGFAYGEGTHALEGKALVLALTAAGSQDAYSPAGYQRHELRTFLTPFEQTARLCRMTFPAPYVLYGSLEADEGDRIEVHVAGYRRLLEALRDDSYDTATTPGTVDARTLALQGAKTG